MSEGAARINASAVVASLPAYPLAHEPRTIENRSNRIRGTEDVKYGLLRGSHSHRECFTKKQLLLL